MKKSLSILSLTAFLFVASCNTPKHVDSGYAYTPSEVECLRNNNDGTQTVRAWGQGKNKVTAIENAKKNAVRTFLFSGINAGAGDCTKRPIVTEVNAEQKYENYFNRFFAPGGEFLNYVSLKDEKNTSRVKAADRDVEKWGVIVTVNCYSLKQKMINDGIIQP